MKKNFLFFLTLHLYLTLCAYSCYENSEAPSRIYIPEGKADSLEGAPEISIEQCPGGQQKLPDGIPAEWTIMIYAAADNNLEPFVIKDINEMEYGYNDNEKVNIIVQIDKFSEKGVWRYRIKHDGNKRKITSPVIGYNDEEPNSGDWKLLASFGEWASICYPAKNYMLIVSGHGNGWTDRSNPEIMSEREKALKEGEAFREIAYDQTNGSSIYISGLEKALKHIASKTKFTYDPPETNRLIIYGSDACLMQTIEVGWQVKDTVRYIIGSEESEPATGWPYDLLIKELSQKPDYYGMMPEMLAKFITESYGISYENFASVISKSVTLSAIDTTYIQNIKENMESISAILTSILPYINRQVWLARNNSYSFGEAYTDLGKFLFELQKAIEEETLTEGNEEAYLSLRNKINETEKILEKLVSSKSMGHEYTDAGGISIFFPFHPTTWFLDLESYSKCPFAQETGWYDLLTKLIYEFPYN